MYAEKDLLQLGFNIGSSHWHLNIGLAVLKCVSEHLNVRLLNSSVN